ncbi:MAG: hypothetical protein JW809_16720 [Pirellulales bacterium]|nr:hypothetical protein [Pirellulales bacterium]
MPSKAKHLDSADTHEVPRRARDDALKVGLVGLFACAALLLGQAAAQLPAVVQPTAAAPSESVKLVDGREFFGLIETASEAAPGAWLYLTEIHRPPGRPMFLLVRPIARDSIAGTTRLDATGRATLEETIRRFRNRARIEAAALAAVRLTERAEGDATVYYFESDGFTLASTTDEPTTRRLVVRTEQLFAAYRQVLPPRTEPARPLEIRVFGSMEEYQDYLGEHRLSVANPAVYLREERAIAAGTPLRQYAAELAKIDASHEQLAAELAQLEGQLSDRLKQIGDQLRRQGTHRTQIAAILFREKQRAMREIDGLRGRLDQVDRENAETFDRLTRTMFRRLAHEALHAHLETRVYPPGRRDVPLWLSEGLAMVFEAGLLEDGLLRLDGPNTDVLAPLQEDLRAGGLPLARLLAADPKDFLVGDEGRVEASNRFYQHAWGLAYYLLFNEDVLANGALDRYVASAEAAGDPIRRFETLVGAPLDQFEPKWRAWIGGLP